jgi:hypothetical protein
MRFAPDVSPDAEVGAATDGTSPDGAAAGTELLIAPQAVSVATPATSISARTIRSRA